MSSFSTHGRGESRFLALKRVYNLDRRLVQDPQLYTAYLKFMDKYKTLEHVDIAKQPGKYFIMSS